MLQHLNAVARTRFKSEPEKPLSENLDILEVVAKDPDVSQRQIARETGLSLGQVNLLMKKFVAKGLVKIEGQTAKSVQYHLTPQGLSALADKTLRYIRDSYATVQKTTEQIIRLGLEYRQSGYDIYVVGNNDEIARITALALKEGKIPYKEGLPEPGGKAVVFYWDESLVQECSGLPAVNLMEALS